MGWEQEIAEQKKRNCSVQKSKYKVEFSPGDLRNRGWGPERPSKRRAEGQVCGLRI